MRKTLPCLLCLVLFLIPTLAFAVTGFLPIPSQPLESDSDTYTVMGKNEYQLLNEYFVYFEFDESSPFAAMKVPSPGYSGSQARVPYPRMMEDGQTELLRGYLIDTESIPDIQYELSMIPEKEWYKGFREFRCMTTNDPRQKIGPTALLGPVAFPYEARVVNPEGQSYEDALPVLQVDIDSTGWELGHVETYTTEHLFTGEEVTFTVTYYCDLMAPE